MNPNEEAIIQYLVFNQAFFMEKSRPFREQRDKLLNTEDYSFHSEINKQYEELIKADITDDITKKFAFPAEDVIVVLENLNINEYLK